MALTLDYVNKIVHSDASITDGVAFHADLRDIEASMFGILYPVIHTYAAIDIGGGAIFPAIAFINGWTLQFPAGTFNISGFNLDADINQVNDCYVERMQSAAYAVTAVGGTGLSSSDIEAVADAVRAELGLELGTIEYLKKVVRNKRKITSEKTLVVYDNDGVTPILNKPLKDKDGGAIADLASGVLAQEDESSV